jgi:PAS domain S-box-containing protein
MPTSSDRRPAEDGEGARKDVRAGDEQFRALAELSPDGIAVIDGSSHFLYANPAALRMAGAREMADLAGRSCLEFLGAKEASKVRRRIKNVLGGRAVPQNEVEVVRMDGTRLAVETSTGPIDWNGERAVQVLWRDVTERKASLAALAEGERRQRMLIEGIPQIIWRSKPEGRRLWSSPQWATYVGRSTEGSTELGWLDPVHPDDRAEALAAWARAGEEGGFKASYRLRGADGSYRWFETRAMPLRDERSGRIVEWFGTSTDVDDLRRLREHERQLLYELQHRVRNSLAVIRAIARRTGELSDSVDDFASHLDGRIDAFARVQAGVTRSPGAGLDLAMMVADELTSYAVREDRQFSLNGPSVWLDSKAAGMLGLAIHELATNAVKFGALSSGAADAHIHVDWSISGRPPALRLQWKESGLSGISAPQHHGFGMDLFERVLPYELRAKVDITFEADGIRCSMVLPMERLSGPKSGE